MNKPKQKKRIWAALAVTALALGAAHASANVGAWANAGAPGYCNRGESRIVDSTTLPRSLLLASSAAPGTDVIAQSDTNCTTQSASYGTSQVQDCRVSMQRHRCISNP